MDIDKGKQNISQTLSHTFQGDEEPNKWKHYLIHNVFPLIACDKDFWRLYQHHTHQLMAEITSHRSSGLKTGTHLPSFSKSGRSISIASSDSIGSAADDSPRLAKWLSDPLATLGGSEIIELLCQSIHSARTLGKEKVAPWNMNQELELEDSLDTDRDSLSWINSALGGRQQLRAPVYKTRSTTDLLDLLAKYLKKTPAEVLGMINRGLSAARTANCLQEGVYKKLRQQLRCVYIRQLIEDNSKILRGRHRWSTVYIETLFLGCLRQPKNERLATLRTAIVEASRYTSALSIQSLQRQIGRMMAAGKVGLVQDLYRAGIRAEIMGRPTIFLDASYAQLVTYGFALVERVNGDVKYKLSEPLAVHAVMDHLRNKGTAEYEHLMLQWLTHTQDDHEVQAMFGKATEWYLAAVSP